MNLYESGEMYLETILVLKEKKGMVRSIDIAREMNYSKPSISNGMKHLKEGGYITIDDEGFISFTESGEAVARKIYERHTVMTDIFEKLGVSPETAQDDACKIEHVLSDETFEAIKKYAAEKGI